MKEYIETIPVNDAFLSGDECPFCHLQRLAEQHTIRYVVGPAASYMEPDVRAATGEPGFCDRHLKSLYDYGNTLGSALILQTYYARLLTQFQAQEDAPPPKKALFSKKAAPEDTYWQQLHRQMDSCFICQRIDYHMQRYYKTFFFLLKEAEFRSRVEQCKGFCFRHFAQVMELAPELLQKAQTPWFYTTMHRLMEENLVRVKEDLDWLVAKYDYRNAGADWKNSRDALPRAIQKLQGIYPADPPYKEK